MADFDGTTTPKSADPLSHALADLTGSQIIGSRWQGMVNRRFPA
jgi:hypothetical protein